MTDFNHKISSDENEIIGEWIFIDGEIVNDINSKRIEYLISNELTELLIHKEGWFRLYIDRRDKRFWELQYLQSELQSGGPKSLVVLDKAEVLKNILILGNRFNVNILFHGNPVWVAIT